MSFYGVGKGSANSLFQSIVTGQNNLISQSGVDDTSQPGDLFSGQQVNERSFIEGRIPWIISTIEHIRNGKGVVFAANPRDVTWNMGLRETLTKTATGTVTHFWRHPQRQTGFDEFKLTLNLQSGNLLPYTGANGQSRVSQGLLNFYDFMNIVDAPRLTEQGEINYVTIRYHSTLFPELTLLGMIDPSGIRFTDSASSPHEVQSWSVDFIVQDTQPRLSISNGTLRKSDLLGAYIDNINNKSARMNGPGSRGPEDSRHDTGGPGAQDLAGEPASTVAGPSTLTDLFG